MRKSVFRYVWFNWIKPAERDRRILAALAKNPASVPQLEEELGCWLPYPIFWKMEEKELIEGLSDDLIMPERLGKRARFYAYKLPGFILYSCPTRRSPDRNP